MAVSMLVLHQFYVTVLRNACQYVQAAMHTGASAKQIVTDVPGYVS